jgi:putative endonuclease
MAKHNLLGIEGERMALDYLRSQGYEILETNWRFERKEIDIIARKDNIVAIVEVKTRSTDYFGAPEESVTLTKQRFLIEAADVYMQQLDFEAEVRFDIISIVNKTINHIQEAFIPLID